MSTLPLTALTEKQFETQLFSRDRKHPGIARVQGWACYHTLRSKGSEPGYPDWTLARERVVFIECKRQAGKLSDAQKEWVRRLLAARAEIYVCRPADLEPLAAVLSHRGDPRLADPSSGVYRAYRRLSEQTRREAA